MTQHDTPEAVEDDAARIEQRGFTHTAAMLLRLHQRAVEADRDRQKSIDLAERHMNEKHKAQKQAKEDWDMLQSRIADAESALATARADALRELHQGCPFEHSECDIEPETPCPVCGDLGTWDNENLSNPSRCIFAAQKKKPHDR